MSSYDFHVAAVYASAVFDRAYLDTYFVQVLVCEKMKLNGEYYFAIVMDRAFKVSMTYMACTC